MSRLLEGVGDLSGRAPRLRDSRRVPERGCSPVPTPHPHPLDAGTRWFVLGASEAAFDGGSAGVLTARPGAARAASPAGVRRSRATGRAVQETAQRLLSPCCQAAAIAWLPALIDDSLIGQGRPGQLLTPAALESAAVAKAEPSPAPPASARRPAGPTPRSSAAPRFRPRTPAPASSRNTTPPA
jgi:hypothetical protein